MRYSSICCCIHPVFSEAYFKAKVLLNSTYINEKSTSDKVILRKMCTI